MLGRQTGNEDDSNEDTATIEQESLGKLTSTGTKEAVKTQTTGLEDREEWGGLRGGDAHLLSSDSKPASSVRGLWRLESSRLNVYTFSCSKFAGARTRRKSTGRSSHPVKVS